MDGLSNLKNKAMSERISEQIIQYIKEHHLEVGSKLPNEYELSAIFNVGRSTIRESIKILASHDILWVKHGSGTYVLSTASLYNDPLGLNSCNDKMKLALDLVDVRMMLEPNIAELAAANRTEDEARLLVQYCAAVRNKIENKEDYVQADVLFHSHIAKCSHNMVVEPLIPIIDAAVVIIANITKKTLLAATVETHEQILNAILDKDPLGAKAAMSMHLALNRNIIKQEYLKRNPKP